jgi:hypothetical protein
VKKMSFEDWFVLLGSVFLGGGGWALYRFGSGDLQTVGVLVLAVAAAAFADLVVVLGSRVAIRAREAEMVRAEAVSRRNRRIVR